MDSDISCNYPSFCVLRPILVIDLQTSFRTFATYALSGHRRVCQDIVQMVFSMDKIGVFWRSHSSICSVLYSEVITAIS